MDITDPPLRYCFTYGSLMCEDIMAHVCGAAVQGEAAVLAEHSCHPVRDEDYPGMVPAPGRQVRGILYRDLPATAWPRLDAFEGKMYARCRVSVQIGNGEERVEAWTYLFLPEYRPLLLHGDWDYQRFLAEGKARFSRSYLGFGYLKAQQTA